MSFYFFLTDTRARDSIFGAKPRLILTLFYSLPNATHVIFPFPSFSPSFTRRRPLLSLSSASPAFSSRTHTSHPRIPLYHVTPPLSFPPSYRYHFFCHSRCLRNAPIIALSIRSRFISYCKHHWYATPLIHTRCLLNLF